MRFPLIFFFAKVPGYPSSFASQEAAAKQEVKKREYVTAALIAKLEKETVYSTGEEVIITDPIELPFEIKQYLDEQNSLLTPKELIVEFARDLLHGDPDLRSWFEKKK